MWLGRQFVCPGRQIDSLGRQNVIPGRQNRIPGCIKYYFPFIIAMGWGIFKNTSR